MISPFEVYLVMQLDSLKGMFSVLTGVCVVFGVILAATLPIWADEHLPLFKGAPEAGMKWFKRVVAAGLLFLFVGTALPSTKTAAAMIVLPALTSEEVVKPLGDEARELYQLAKDALRKAVDTPDAPEKSHVE